MPSAPGSYGMGWCLPRLDEALSALLVDLRERGMLDNTLVVVAGEFGRTPNINAPGANPGRQHWPSCYSAIIAGAGIRGGGGLRRIGSDRRVRQGQAGAASGSRRHDLPCVGCAARNAPRPRRFHTSHQHRPANPGDVRVRRPAGPACRAEPVGQGPALQAEITGPTLEPCRYLHISSSSLASSESFL